MFIRLATGLLIFEFGTDRLLFSLLMELSPDIPKGLIRKSCCVVPLGHVEL